MVAIPSQTHRARRLRLAAAISSIVLAALIAAPSALAWYEYFVWSGWFNPGGIALSGFNDNVDYVEMDWDSRGGTQAGQVTLCYPNSQCIGYTSGNLGNISEGFYQLSYGRGKCNSWTGNTLGYTVNFCYVAN